MKNSIVKQCNQKDDNILYNSIKGIQTTCRFCNTLVIRFIENYLIVE